MDHITYIPLARGSAYLVAIMDWASRGVLAWRLSNTMDTQFCLEALVEALERFGGPGLSWAGRTLTTLREGGSEVAA